MGMDDWRDFIAYLCICIGVPCEESSRVRELTLRRGGREMIGCNGYLERGRIIAA